MTTTGITVHDSGGIERAREILTPEALDLVARLHRAFNNERIALLKAREARQRRIDAGERPDFVEKTRGVREADWKVAAAPKDLEDRRVEITGPVERKMMINALNSGAKIFMADFEDANAPTWGNVVAGQINLLDAVNGTIEFKNPDGRVYRLGDETATLVVRPRGWHLVDKHVRVDGEPVSASLLDFALYVHHNHEGLRARGSGPYYYIPKLESHLEARLWNEVFNETEDALGLARGTIRCTVLVETILAAFEMDEILHELREHVVGLNAGRWDYIFSIIKRFRNDASFLLPDRGDVTMDVPFMRAYTELLVKTCHKRGAHAIGGMAAFIPSRKDADVNERALRKVREDKIREANAGFDGTWVAHPDLVSVARAVFDDVLEDKPNQLDRMRDDVHVTPEQLLDMRIDGAKLTRAGLHHNVNVGLRYVDSWLRGVGAAAIDNLMEDAATAEISRGQVWQWIRHGATLREGVPVTRELVRDVIETELSNIRALYGEEFEKGRFKEARAVFESVVLDEDFQEFLTLPAYEYL